MVAARRATSLWGDHHRCAQPGACSVLPRRPGGRRPQASTPPRRPHGEQRRRPSYPEFRVTQTAQGGKVEFLAPGSEGKPQRWGEVDIWREKMSSTRQR